MKKVLLLLAVFPLVLPGTASAQGRMGFDISGNYATEPKSGFGGEFGFEVGFNADFATLGVPITLGENIQSQARVSVGFYDFDRTFQGINVDYERIPVFLGGRFIMPVSPPLNVYGDLGFELSFDKEDRPGISPLGVPFVDSKRSLRFGVRPQVGIIYRITESVFLGANLGYHLIKDDYCTLGAMVGLNLP
jgi:hypothetical protein